MENYIIEDVVDWGEASGFLMYTQVEDIETSEFNSFLRTQAILPTQTHSLNVAITSSQQSEYPDTDALITFTPGETVGILTADCVPILLYAPDISAVAAVHAGWRGTLGGILDNALAILMEKGADLSSLKAFIGPSITQTYYEVDKALADKFIAAGFDEYVLYPKGSDAKPCIDLKGVNFNRLLRHGVKEEQIAVHPGCTYSSVDKYGVVYPSHRRSKGSPLRMLTAISLI